MNRIKAKLHPKEKAALKKLIMLLPFGNLLLKTDFSALFACCFRVVLLDKETFCVEGQPCDYIGYLVSGYLYSKYLSEKGVYHVNSIFFTPQFRIVLDFPSFKSKGKAFGTITSRYKSTLICISIKDLEALYITNPNFVNIVRMIVEKSHEDNKAFTEKLSRLKNPDRIRAFLKLFPRLKGKFTDAVIASYLHVSRQEM